MFARYMVTVAELSLQVSIGSHAGFMKKLYLVSYVLLYIHIRAPFDARPRAARRCGDAIALRLTRVLGGRYETSRAERSIGFGSRDGSETGRWLFTGEDIVQDVMCCANLCLKY